MRQSIARSRIEKIEGVARTSIEWELSGGSLLSVLVVEVAFDTDPKSDGYRPLVMEEIESATKEILLNETTMNLGGLRIRPAVNKA